MSCSKVLNGERKSGGGLGTQPPLGIGSTRLPVDKTNRNSRPNHTSHHINPSSSKPSSTSLRGLNLHLADQYECSSGCARLPNRRWHNGHDRLHRSQYVNDCLYHGCPVKIVGPVDIGFRLSKTRDTNLDTYLAVPERKGSALKIPYAESGNDSRKVSVDGW